MLLDFKTYYKVIIVRMCDRLKIVKLVNGSKKRLQKETHTVQSIYFKQKC